MRTRVEIQNIEDMRRRAGIDDVELREAIRGLRVGALVKVTLLVGATHSSGETLLVRITSIRGNTFRGKLVKRPTSASLSGVQAGLVLTFTPSLIHSLATERRSTPGETPEKGLRHGLAL
jgi:hypothetical protein